MSKQDYRLTAEPRGALLRKLLGTGAARCDSFLVTVTGMEMTDHGANVLRSLEPFLTRRLRTNNYPGGSLTWGTVQVSTYDLNSESLQIILGATDRLYGWQEPDLPNDLCLMQGSEPWLITMASDGVAILALGADELASIRAAVPGLRVTAIHA